MRVGCAFAGCGGHAKAIEHEHTNIFIFVAAIHDGGATASVAIFVEYETWVNIQVDAGCVGPGDGHYFFCFPVFSIDEGVGSEACTVFRGYDRDVACFVKDVSGVLEHFCVDDDVALFYE